MKLQIIAIGAILMLSACGEGGTSHDKDYYAAHEAEAITVSNACRAGTVTGEECQNAGDGLSEFHRKQSKEAGARYSKSAGTSIKAGI